VTDDVLAGAMDFEVHHRDTATAFAMARRVVKWHQDHPNTAATGPRLQQEGRAWLLLGGLDSAERAFRQWVARDSNSIGAAGHLALTLALKGDSVRARAMADSIGLVQRKWLFGAHTFWRGAVLGALGDREIAVRLLQQSFIAGQDRQGHRSLQLRSLRGYPPFEALVAPER
jgi:tetratricopeptide (TPR) repeat protein